MFCTVARSQNARFIIQGEIEFEKKINLHALFDKEKSWTADYKKTIPQFKTTYFNLLFDTTTTLYKPGRINPANANLWELPAEDNIVYVSLKEKISTTQKRIATKYFLIKDSVRKIQWKLTDETRDIAGFVCKRANALIMDSIYIVAFFTEQIMVSSGPESFSGLPGMILGLAIPNEHIGYFATRISLTLKKENMVAPSRGMITDNVRLQEYWLNSLKTWEKDGYLVISWMLM
jgi:GLPGLI family protein